jgi:Concanavalin A-like lectin/glucanases superfamily
MELIQMNTNKKYTNYVGQLLLLLLLTINIFGQIKVLEFDKTQNHTVVVQNFYPTYSPDSPRVLFNKFTLEIWAIATNQDIGGYFASDDYGGGHAILFGLFKGTNGLYAMSGNILTRMPDGSLQTISFSSPQIIKGHEWHLYAVELNNTVITTFVDGIAVSQSPFIGNRISSTFTGLSGTMHIGGSDHINFNGRIAKFRLIEGAAVYGGQHYVAQISFKDVVRIRGTNVWADASLLFDFTNQSLIIADLSNGYNGKKHNGQLRNASNGLYYDNNGGKLPKWVIDNDYPETGDKTIPETIIPITPPNDAVIFDSFSRTDKTSVHGQSVNLGQTEVGNKIWSVNSPFFIQNEQMVFGGNNYYGSALIDGQSAGKISVDRIAGFETGLRFRSKDFNNGYAAFTTGNLLILDKLVNGGIAERIAAPLSACTSLSAEFRNANITVSCGSSLITYSDTTFKNSNKIGLYAYTPTDLNRFENFKAVN